MVNHYCIFDLLDNILPSGDKSKNDTLRLEYLSACKIMENEKFIMKILPHIPASMFDPLLQSAIYNSYLEFINNYDIPQGFLRPVFQREDIFPESLGILILNWPYEELILRNKIPPLHPPVKIFPSNYIVLESQNQTVRQVEYMILVFQIFWNKLIQFVTNTVFKGSSSNKHGFSCNLRRLDVSGFGRPSGLEHLESSEPIRCFLHRDGDPNYILQGITNSKIDTFGHKIEIFVDAEIVWNKKGFGLLRKIIEKSLNPDFGVSVFFKGVEVRALAYYNYSRGPSLSDLFKVLALRKCEYIRLCDFNLDKKSIENLYCNLPEIVGISLWTTGINKGVDNLDFFNSFENLEQVRLYNTRVYIHNSLPNSVLNMSKGLKYLNLSKCTIESHYLECLANSIHSNTLLELDLSSNGIRNDSEAAGLIVLCQNLKAVKVLIVDDSSLNTLSSNAVSKLVNAFTDCYQLEFLSMRQNPFSLEIINIIIDGLAENKSLRYLSLNLPGVMECNDAFVRFVPIDENKEYQHNLCKTFHDKINRYRQSPLYISWWLARHHQRLVNNQRPILSIQN